MGMCFDDMASFSMDGPLASVLLLKAGSSSSSDLLLRLCQHTKLQHPSPSALAITGVLRPSSPTRCCGTAKLLGDR